MNSKKAYTCLMVGFFLAMLPVLPIIATKLSKQVTLALVDQALKEFAENPQAQLDLVTQAVRKELGEEFTGSVVFGQDYHTDGTRLFIPKKMGWIIALKNNILDEWNDKNPDTKRFIVNQSINALTFTPERKAQLEAGKAIENPLERAEKALPIIKDQVAQTYNSFVGSIDHEYKHIKEQHQQKLSKLWGCLSFATENGPMAAGFAAALYKMHTNTLNPPKTPMENWKTIMIPMAVTAATVGACSLFCTELAYQYRSRQHEREADAAIRKTPEVLSEKYKFYSGLPKNWWYNGLPNPFLEHPRPTDRAAYFDQELIKIGASTQEQK